MNIRYKIQRGRRIAGNILANCFEPPVVLLTYHRIAVLAEDPYQLAVTPENFRRQLDFLRGHFQILPFDGAWDRGDGVRFVITFDDGYADNLENALPILREFEVPAIFFVAAGAVDAGREFPWDGGNAPQRREFRTLRLGELQELAANPLALIGSHTVTHPRLSELSAEKQHEEIAGGHRRLEEQLGRKLSFFSYPFGNYQDFNADSVRICRELGLTRVAANYPGQYHHVTDPLAIPRHVVRNWNPDEFRKRLFRFKYL